VYNLLEETPLEIWVVNARHIKAVPGRKTDVRDCEWLAALLRHGLLQPSLVPTRTQRELRAWTRYRTSLVQERSREVNRLEKTLEGANSKLGSVASSLQGRSAREMLDGLLAEDADPAHLAHLGRGRLRSKTAQLEHALTGRLGPHQRFLLREQLAHLDALEASITRVSEEIAIQVGSVTETLERLESLPGIGRRLAEMGLDVARFATASHRAAWAGLAPGNNQSGGKRVSARLRQGSPALRTALVEAAHAAARTKKTYLAAQ
jgi:transposase